MHKMPQVLKIFRYTVATLLASAVLLAGCGSDNPIQPERYRASDALYQQLLAGVEASDRLTYFTDIDHSRLAHEKGVSMPPSRVIMVRDPALEIRMISQRPLLGLELPLRALAFETAEGGAAVIHNQWEYIAARHGVDAPELGAAYQQSMQALLREIPAQQLRHFPTGPMPDDAIVTYDSTHSFEDTVARARAAIDAQDDTVWFGELDFQSIAANAGEELPPATLLLFGGPEPGGKAMSGAPALGLDTFCQKLLIWQDEAGVTHISFNDLVTLAKRQEASLSPILWAINFRLKSTFSDVAD